MSMVQTFFGSAVIVGALSLAIQAVAPSPPPITVHRLAYADGVVTQDRTVKGGGDVFWMQWTASVVDPDTHLPIDGCKGSGAFNYPTGRLEARMSLQAWVGNDACHIPPGVPVQLQAVYTWGDTQVSAKSEVFEVRG